MKNLVILALIVFPFKAMSEYLEAEIIDDTIYYNFTVNPYNAAQILKLENYYIQVSNDYGQSFEPIRDIWRDTPYYGWADPIYITGVNGEYILQYIFTDTTLYQYSLDGGNSWIGYNTFSPNPLPYRWPNSSYFEELKNRRAIITTKPFIRAISVHPYHGLLIHDLVADTVIKYIPFSDYFHYSEPMLYVYPLLNENKEMIVLINQSGFYDECQIWWSTDAGDTWERPETNPVNNYTDKLFQRLMGFAVNPLNSAEMMVLFDFSDIVNQPPSLNNTVVFSTDRGYSWYEVYNIECWTTFVTNIVGGLYSTVFKDEVFWLHVLGPRDGGKLPNHVYYSNEIGITFKPLNIILNSEIYEISQLDYGIRFCPVDGSTFYSQGYPRNKTTGKPAPFTNYRFKLKSGEIGINSNQNVNSETVVNGSRIILSSGFNVLQFIGLDGSLVRTFNLAPGQTEVSWHGTDSHGNQLPSGIYFARAEDEHGNVATAKMVLVR